jgi:hypothetical protein
MRNKTEDPRAPLLTRQIPKQPVGEIFIEDLTDDFGKDDISEPAKKD